MLLNPVKYPLDKIVVTDRAREGLGNLEELKESIRKRGLLNAIIVCKKDSELVAGYRRLTCCRDLGWKEIDVRFDEDMDELDKRIVELEENLHEPLSWFEQAKLRVRIHNIFVEQYGKAVKGHESDGWSLEKTAQELNVSRATLSQDIHLIETSNFAPTLSELTSRKQALKSIHKMKEMAVLTRLSQLESEDGDETGESPGKVRPYRIVNDDALKFTSTLKDESIDLVIFDPPWGIDADIIATSRGLSGDKMDYDDSEYGSRKFCRELLPELFRVMKDGSHMYMFIGTQFISYWTNILLNRREIVQPDWTIKYETLEENRKWIFDVRIVPLIWIKEGGGYTDFDYKHMPRYEAVLFCVKGVRRLNYAISDVFDYKRPPSTERIHPQQKSIELIKEFIKVSSHEEALVYDPCFGSGTTIVAAITNNRRAIGCEQSKESFLRAKNWIEGVRVKESINENDKV